MSVKERKKTVDYVVCNDKNTLLYLANLGCIEMNPWSSRRSVRRPRHLTRVLIARNDFRADLFSLRATRVASRPSRPARAEAIFKRLKARGDLLRGP
jgi:hypothetical protein